MKRRRVVQAGIGLAALAAGVAWQLRGGGDQTGHEPELWAQRFQRPDGGPLVLSTWRGQPTLLNFWATWCAPCVTEMPLLDTFHHDHQDRGWQVVGLAADQVGPVRDFLTRQPVGFPIAMAGLEGIELSRRLGNRSGGLPFTLVFGSDGRRKAHKLGALTRSDLDRWVRDVS